MLSAAERRTRREQSEHEHRINAAKEHRFRKFAEGDAVLDVRLENPLGRLNFHGLISDGEYEAGKRYAAMAFEYLQSIGAPYPFTQSCESGSLPGPMEMPADEECEYRKREYNGAHEALYAVGQRPAKMVKQVAVYEEWPHTEYDYILLKFGLKTLADYYARGSNVVAFPKASRLEAMQAATRMLNAPKPYKHWCDIAHKIGAY
jgi:hypothetical protein